MNDYIEKEIEKYNIEFYDACAWLLKWAVIVGILLLAAKGAMGDEIDNLIDAIGIVESNNNDKAVGDAGKAIGRYQIHKAYWIDGCQYLKVDWPYSDAIDAKKARQVVRAYFARYGKGKTIEQLARIHNGGVYGYKKEATIKYWLKVQRRLKNV